MNKLSTPTTHLLLLLLSFAMLAASSFNAVLATEPENQNTENQQEQDNEHESENDEDHDHDHDHHEKQKIETIQIRASRLGRFVTESATRTEIINREEIEEKMSKMPGNIEMLVAETGGVRVQTTSPALGNSNIRLQGLFGRYTQLLSDGLPLYGNQASSLGLLQIPPTDLSSVEIIKGSASSLYGGNALGGVINLISRIPSNEREGEVLVNTTSRGAQDITSYFASPISDTLSASLTSGIHHQQEQDLDDDGWIDIAGYERGSLRSRLYWQGEQGANLYVTLGAMKENRNGGTKEGATVPTGIPFELNQNTRRFDIGFVYDATLTSNINLNLKGSAMTQAHEHQYGSLFEDDRHESYLLESSIAGYTDKTAWLIGAAFLADKFTSDSFSDFNYTFETPGIFSQVDYEIIDDVSASLSARVDHHSAYGTKFSPRLSLLYTPDNWTIRGAYGQGFYAPTPFTEEIDEAGLSRLAPLNNIQAEEATTASLDISYIDGGLETNMSFFSSNVENVTELEEIETINSMIDARVRLTNVLGESEINGVELLMRYKWRDFKFISSYLYIDATREDEIGFGQTPISLTPQHSAGFVFMWEEHDSHVVGFEMFYTGTQALDGNPYREMSDPYWHLGLLGQKTFGNLTVFINAENILDVRQSKEDPILLPEQAASGRWTTDIWSRNDGLVVNAGFRYEFE